MVCIIERKMSVGELIKRYAFFVAGLFVMAFGVSFSIVGRTGYNSHACGVHNTSDYNFKKEI